MNHLRCLQLAASHKLSNVATVQGLPVPDVMLRVAWFPGSQAAHTLVAHRLIELAMFAKEQTHTYYFKDHPILLPTANPFGYIPTSLSLEVLHIAVLIVLLTVTRPGNAAFSIVTTIFCLTKQKTPLILPVLATALERLAIPSMKYTAL